MTRHHILDIYGIHLHLATTKAEWKQLRREHDWLTKTPGAAGLAWFNAGTPPILVLWINAKRHDSTAELVDTIAHEATHGATQILDHIGHASARAPIDEPHAYLVGWLAGWMWEGCTDAGV